MSDRQWCVILNSDNPHDFQVWGPYPEPEADKVYERLSNSPNAWGSKKLTMWPMSPDWEEEDKRMRAA